MTTLLLLLTVIIVAAVWFALRSRQTTGADSATEPTEDTPTLPVSVKPAFFTRSEHAFFTALEETLSGSSYRVFPNVRLNDIFTINATPTERRSVYPKLRDKHVDFLIVSADTFAPVLAIELDGDSHNTRTQQKRDAVKDLAFHSANLTLLRFDARTRHTPGALYDTLVPHLGAAPLPA